MYNRLDKNRINLYCCKIFCINMHSLLFALQICVSLKKKCLQIYNVTEDKMTLIRDVSTTDIPITMVNQLRISEEFMVAL